MKPLLFVASAALLLSGQPNLRADDPFPPAISSWDATTKEKQRSDGRELLRRISEEVAQGNKNIQIPKGDYRFSQVSEGRYPSHIIWKGWDGVTLDFQGSTLWLEEPQTAITLSESRGVTLKNVILDWDPLPFMQGVITAINADGTFDVKLDPGYEQITPSMGPEGKRKGGTGWRGLVFDSQTRELKAGQASFSLDFSWAARNPDDSYRVRFRGFYDLPLAESGLEKGDRVVILARLGRALRLENLTDCVLEDVTLYSSPFVAFASWAGSGTVFRRCQILKRPDTDRLIGGNADGINCANMERGPLIEECVMENLGDDFVNVHASLARVIAQPAPDQLVSSVLNSRRRIDREVTLEFYERSTMSFLGTRKARVEFIPEWTIKKEECLADLDHKWHSGDAAALAYGKKVVAHRLILDEPLAIKTDAVIVCPEYSSPGAVIRNNRFRGSLSRGIRQQSPDALIENNVISRTAGYGLSLIGHTAFWGEGPFVRKAEIINNRFEDTYLFKGAPITPAAIFVQEGNYRDEHLPRTIVMRGNTISRTGGSGIIARGVDGLKIQKNHISNYGFYPVGSAKKVEEGDGYGLAVDHSKEVLLESNVVENPGPFASGDIFIGGAVQKAGE